MTYCFYLTEQNTQLLQIAISSNENLLDLAKENLRTLAPLVDEEDSIALFANVAFHANLACVLEGLYREPPFTQEQYQALLNLYYNKGMASIDVLLNRFTSSPLENILTSLPTVTYLRKTTPISKIVVTTAVTSDVVADVKGQPSPLMKMRTSNSASNSL